MKNKLRNLKNKAVSIFTDKKGLTQSTETILLVVFVVVLIGAFFAPAVTEWFAGVMTNLETKTTELFSFAP